MTAPAVLPELPHTHVVGLRAAGKTVAEIAKQTGLNERDVQDALDNATHGPLTARAGTSASRSRPRTPRTTGTTTKTTTRTATTAATGATTEPITDTVGDLLDWGSRHDNLRVRAAARRIRDDLAELRRRRGAEAEARAAAIELEIRMAELEAAKERARITGDAVTNPAPRTPEDTDD